MKNNKRRTALSLGMLLGDDLGAYEIDLMMTKLKSLSRAHHRQCENACNGEGYVGKTYYGFCHRNGERDDNVYLKDGTDVFTNEIERIEDKIYDLATLIKNTNKKRIVNIEFQRDPRGATVKVQIGSHIFCPAFDF